MSDEAGVIFRYKTTKITRDSRMNVRGIVGHLIGKYLFNTTKSDSIKGRDNRFEIMFNIINFGVKGLNNMFNFKKIKRS
jgi:hypothetical protein